MLHKLLGAFGLLLAAASAWCGTIGEGIGNTSLTWTTGGEPSAPDENVNWSYCSEDGHSGKECVTSGAGGAGVAASWLKTTVIGPCRISFYYKVQTYRGTFQVTCDSRELYQYSGETGINAQWKHAEYKIPEGEHTITFTYKHPGMGYANKLNGVRIDDFKVVGAPKSAKKSETPPEQKTEKADATKGKKKLGEGIGNTSLTWTTGGEPSAPGENVKWSYCTEDGHLDKVCVTSGAGGAGVAASWLKTTVAGPCIISFYYKLQTCGGIFQVTCDADKLLNYTGETGTDAEWKYVEYKIPEGKHTIKFIYVHSGKGYADKLNGVRIDDFKVTAAKNNSN